MIPVSQIYDEAVRIVGNSDESFVFSRITDAVELLANKGEFDPFFGVLDVCVSDDCCVTLPREVEAILALNECGYPAVGRDQLFRFHLNGGGDIGPKLEFEWQDAGFSPVYRDLNEPKKLMAFCANLADVGKLLWVYGTDNKGNTLRTQLEDGSWVDGLQLPLSLSYVALPADAPLVGQITRVRKDLTTGPVRLSTLDDDGVYGALLGVYQWDETEPRFRRIRLSQKASWVRIAFRRSQFIVRSKDDLLPVRNAQAVLMMLRALWLYNKLDFANAEAAEATAVRWLTEEERTSSSQTVAPIQVYDGASTQLVDCGDYVD